MFIARLLLLKIILIQINSLLIIISLEYFTVLNCLAISFLRITYFRGYVLLIRFLVLGVIEGVLGISLVVGLSRSEGLSLF